MDKETLKKVRKALAPYRLKTYSFNYRGKRFALNFDPRTGMCSDCGKGAGDEYINTYGKVAKIRNTQLHHLKYDDDHPLDNTIELCESCHSKITYKTTIAIVPLEKTIEIFAETGKIVHRYRDYKIWLNSKK